MLSYISQSVWSMYLRHEQISEDPIYVSYIQGVIGIAKKQLGKVNYRWQSVADSFRAVNLHCIYHKNTVKSCKFKDYSQPELLNSIYQYS